MITIFNEYSMSRQTAGSLDYDRYYNLSLVWDLVIGLQGLWCTSWRNRFKYGGGGYYTSPRNAQLSMDSQRVFLL
jgi:hypothetical protein